jgi:hypothetical protein
MAKVAVVELYWDKSISLDVIEQHLMITNVGTGELFVDEVLDPHRETFTVEIPEKVVAEAALTVNDGVHASETVSVQIVVGDLTAPQPVTGLSYDIVATKTVGEPVTEPNSVPDIDIR